nr:MAG TPA: hypothetical protein [Caudoviricetes sp.]
MRCFSFTCLTRVIADIGVAPNVAPIVRNCLRHFQKVLKNMLTMFDNRCIL